MTLAQLVSLFMYLRYVVQEILSNSINHLIILSLYSENTQEPMCDYCHMSKYACIAMLGAKYIVRFRKVKIKDEQYSWENCILKSQYADNISGCLVTSGYQFYHNWPILEAEGVNRTLTISPFKRQDGGLSCFVLFSQLCKLLMSLTDLT